MTQTEMIKEHLIDNGHIEPLTALNKYGCYRLSDVILRLRKRGFKIDTIMREYTKEDGTTKKYGIYYWRGYECRTRDI